MSDIESISCVTENTESKASLTSQHGPPPPPDPLVKVVFSHRPITAGRRDGQPPTPRTRRQLQSMHVHREEIKPTADGWNGKHPAVLETQQQKQQQPKNDFNERSSKHLDDAQRWRHHCGPPLHKHTPPRAIALTTSQPTNRTAARQKNRYPEGPSGGQHETSG
ncbi:hypothetical protein JOQ06_006440, partial [Pogonophryne albipinna]